MRRISALLVIFLIFYGCSYNSIYAESKEDREKEYQKVEIILSDFSKKVTAYYLKQNQEIPKNFDEKQFMEILEKTYPDQSKVELIKKNFIIKARAVNNIYTVILCNPKTGNKLMEDLNCNLSQVEIRCWDKEDICPCTFEENWKRYCK